MPRSTAAALALVLASRAFHVLSLLATTPLPSASQATTVPILQVGRIGAEARPVIDGRVHEATWASVAPYSEFIQQEPYDGQPATERTDSSASIPIRPGFW